VRYLLSWLSEFFPGEAPETGRIVEALDSLGLSVANVEEQKPTFSGITIADVLEVWKHPSADRLRMAKVTSGKETFQVVCGAPNLAAGQKVAFAPIGAKLQVPGKGALVIEKASIRNQESFGMICSAFELGIADNHDGILVLPQSWQTGQTLTQYIKPEIILDLEMPSHRWDLLSHQGLARELSIYFWRKEAKELSRNTAPQEFKSSSKPKVTIEVDAKEACKRYMGTVITSVSIAPSPAHILWRLKNLGIKTINNIVDITNYVLLETGQPLHAFDLDKIAGEEIQIRRAKNKEALLALDGKNYELSSDHDLVIADREKPLALAGIIGGELSKVTESTKRVFLECAWFEKGCVRKTSRRLGIKTESSYRFERETDIRLMDNVLERTISLITQSCPQSVCEGKIDVGASKKVNARIEFNTSDIEAILGFEPKAEDLNAILTALSESAKKTATNDWVVEPKSWRSDLKLKEDLAEEVLRFQGFRALDASKTWDARIPVVTNTPKFCENFNHVQKLINDLLTAYMGLGFQEVVNFPLTSAREINHFFSPAVLDACPEVIHPVSAELQYVRLSLLPGLFTNWKHNFNRGKRHIRLQEVGYANSALNWAGLSFSKRSAHDHWQNPKSQPFSFWDFLGTLEALARKYQIEIQKENCAHNYFAFHSDLAMDLKIDGIHLGHLAEIKTSETKEISEEYPMIYMELNLEALSQKIKLGPIQYRPLESLPPVNRDLAVVVDKKINWDQIKRVAQEAAGDYFSQTFPFDIYHGANVGENNKSVAFRVVLRPEEKSFTQDQIQAILQAIIQALEKKLDAKLRK